MQKRNSVFLKNYSPQAEIFPSQSIILSRERTSKYQFHNENNNSQQSDSLIWNINRKVSAMEFQIIPLKHRVTIFGTAVMSFIRKYEFLVNYYFKFFERHFFSGYYLYKISIWMGIVRISFYIINVTFTLNIRFKLSVIIMTVHYTIRRFLIRNIEAFILFLKAFGANLKNNNKIS